MDYPEVTRVFTALRDAPQQRHLLALRRQHVEETGARWRPASHLDETARDQILRELRIGARGRPLARRDRRAGIARQPHIEIERQRTEERQIQRLRLGLDPAMTEQMLS